jgi:CheY-like chemotaxis protein
MQAIYENGEKYGTAATPKEQRLRTSQPIQSRRGRMNNGKILCVESQKEYLGALTYMLEAAGYQVVPASTGSQGISVLMKQPIRGVLLEYDLPDASGCAIRAEMKRIKPEVPVLLFAGVGSQTPFLLRFFDSYLRNAERPGWALQDIDA